MHKSKKPNEYYRPGSKLYLFFHLKKKPKLMLNLKRAQQKERHHIIQIK